MLNHRPASVLLLVVLAAHPAAGEPPVSAIDRAPGPRNPPKLPPAPSAIRSIPPQLTRTPLLEPLSPERIRALLPTLKRSEIVVVDDGQVATKPQALALAWSSAAPEAIRALLLDVDHYSRFVPGVSFEVTAQPYDAKRVTWNVAAPRMRGAFVMAPHPDGRVIVWSDPAVAQWRFLAAEGGGTVVEEIIHNDPWTYDRDTHNWVERAPEVRRAMVGGTALLVLQTIMREASRRAGPTPPITPTTTTAADAAALSLLSAQGPTALIQSEESGGFRSITLLRQAAVPAVDLLDRAAAMDRWREFVPTVLGSSLGERDDEGQQMRLTLDGIFTEVETRFLVMRSSGLVDARAIDGAARGARIRWDVRPVEADRSEATLRANLHASEASLLFRAAIALQPLLEHAFNMGAAIVLMESVARRARERTAERPGDARPGIASPAVPAGPAAEVRGPLQGRCREPLPDSGALHRILADDDHQFPPEASHLDFETTPDGSPLQPGDRLDSTFAARGVSLSTSIATSYVGVNGYPVGGRSGHNSAANVKPEWEGQLTVRFHVPGATDRPAAVRAFGLWIAQVLPGGTRLEAIDARSNIVGTIATRCTGSDFLGFRSEVPVAAIRLVPNEFIDRNYAIDDLVFDTPRSL